MKTANHILDALPEHEQALLLQDSDQVSLRFGERLARIGDEMGSVYFPTTCAVSLVASAGAEGSVATALIGKDGAVGVDELYNSSPSRWTMLVPLPGDALRVPIEQLRRGVQGSRTLESLMRREMGLLLGTASEVRQCTRMDSLEQRAARWLATVNDLAPNDGFPMTADVIGEVLGVDRATADAELAALLEAGIVRRSDSGYLSVADPVRLEDRACEQHGVTLRWNQ